MSLGIKRKLLLVLAVSLVLMAGLHALIASYFTNRQNRESAFVGLGRELFAWRNELQESVTRRRASALAAVGDAVVLNQLSELAALEFNFDRTREKDSGEARTLAYLKSVSLSRLELVLRAADFTSIGVYSGGTLSHYVSAEEAGMRVPRGGSGHVWLSTTVDAKGQLPIRSWPSWAEGAAPPPFPAAMPQAAQPKVAFEFPAADGAVFEIVVPVQGVVEDILTDSDVRSVSRFVSDLAIGGQAVEQSAGTTSRRRTTLAVLVFRKQLDRTALEKIATRTGKWPALFSPDGALRLQLTEQSLVTEELIRRLRTSGSALAAGVSEPDRTAAGLSYYVAVAPWSFEGDTRLILGLADSREPTLQNVRETVTAVLTLTGLILLVSLGAGVFLLGRVIDPIVALTGVVRKIGLKVSGRSGQTSVNELHSIARAAPDEVGELAGAFAFVIEELRLTLETLEQRVQARTLQLQEHGVQLEAANKELEAFSYSVSHDLRAPLRTIDGFSRILLEDYAGRLDQEGVENLDTIRAATKRMGQLIDDLLQLSRVTRTELRRGPVDVSALARDVVDTLNKTSPDRVVEVAIEPDLGAYADERLVKIVLENLIGNAWKFTGRRPDGKIEVGAVSADSVPAFFVRDNGEGFDMAHAARLFQAFQRLHSQAEFPGTGIGLATVQRIIARHGGHVWAEGQPGAGAIFYFTLPREGLFESPG